MASTETRLPFSPWRDGDEWVNRVTGFTVLVEESAATTRGARLTWVATYPPYAPAPPLHFHPQQTEEFAILSGSVRARVEGDVRDLIPGDMLTIRPGEKHKMWNPHPTAAVVRWETTPALNTERWMGLVLTLAQLGRTTAHGTPSLPQLALLLRAHRAEIQLCEPPRVVQALLFPAAALLGRLMRLRGDRVD